MQKRRKLSDELSHISPRKLQLPLHVACTQDNVKIVEMLLHASTASLNETADDLSAVDKDGRTPLLYACLFKNTRIVRYLTQLGKKTNATSADRCINMNFANAAGIVQSEVKGSFIKSDGKFEPVCFRCFCNIPYFQGETALHCAAAGGMADIIELLVVGGADMTATTKTGLTPLHLSCQNGHAAAARALIK